MSIHALSRIPTIGQLYKQGVLKAASKTHFEAKESLLSRVSLHQGDITTLNIDAIVNAANSRLLGGAGVDGAIHAAAGPELREECRTLNGCDTGQAKITAGYKLPARHVIHTVGPVYTEAQVEKKSKQLASCYKASLDLAAQHSLKQVAFPSISTGVYGYPIEDATHLALNEVRRFLDSESGDNLERVIFVVWSDRDKDVYESLIPEYFPPTEVESQTT